MKTVNNLKEIREIYGVTQEYVAKAIGVSRLTVLNWENGVSLASESNREKLSIFYGISPDFFYEKPLDNIAINLVIDTAKREKHITEQSHGKRNKAEDLNRYFSKTTFDEAIRNYIFSMKVLLATADSGNLEDLETAVLINKKMGSRLDLIVHARKTEEKEKEFSNEPTLQEMLNNFSE